MGKDSNAFLAVVLLSNSIAIKNHLPIGSMYWIFTCSWLIYIVNVGKYISPMDLMVYSKAIWFIQHTWELYHQPCFFKQKNACFGRPLFSTNAWIRFDSIRCRQALHGCLLSVSVLRASRCFTAVTGSIPWMAGDLVKQFGLMLFQDYDISIYIYINM